MTKEEIKYYLNGGCRVRHEYFDTHEWVREDEGGMIMEDGARIPSSLFWKDRANNSIWETGWSVVADTEEELIRLHYLNNHRVIKKSEDQKSHAEIAMRILQNGIFGGIRNDKSNPINYNSFLQQQLFTELMDTKQATSNQTITIISADKAREITQANHPETIKKNIADEISKLIINAAGKGESKTVYKVTKSGYHPFIYGLLTHFGYTYCHHEQYDEISISWTKLTK